MEIKYIIIKYDYSNNGNHRRVLDGFKAVYSSEEAAKKDFEKFFRNRYDAGQMPYLEDNPFKYQRALLDVRSRADFTYIDCQWKVIEVAKNKKGDWVDAEGNSYLALKFRI